MSHKVIIVTAPSGAGKTTLVKHAMLKFPQLAFSVSATTREKRSHEVDGIDYYFQSKEDFRELIEKGEFVEWEEVYEGKMYGTLKREVEKLWQEDRVIVFDVDVIGAINLKNYFREKALSIFVKPPSIDVLRQRLMLRKTESEKTLEQRLERAVMEMEKEEEFDRIIVNDSLEEAKKDIEKDIADFLG